MHCPALRLQAGQPRQLPQGILPEAGEGEYQKYLKYLFHHLRVLVSQKYSLGYLEYSIGSIPHQLPQGILPEAVEGE